MLLNDAIDIYKSMRSVLGRGMVSIYFKQDEDEVVLCVGLKTTPTLKYLKFRNREELLSALVEVRMSGDIFAGVDEGSFAGHHSRGWWRYSNDNGVTTGTY